MNPADTQLIPVRALNQVTYCPRLYFLQYVDAVMVHNEHVEGGLFDHRRVNDPDLAHRSRKEGDALHTRSAHLSSEKLGITAILDVIEEKEGSAYPVETKHGSAPRDEDGKVTNWDNDAVQLCAQALLLEEELGRPVPRGAIFYAGTRERVPVEFDEALRQKTLAAIEQVRVLAARDAPPEPLPAELRHRCFGCSLATVCLPEETLYQIERPTTPAAAPVAGITRVLPQSDDGAVLYLSEPGSHVGKRSEHLVIRKDGKEIGRVPIHAIRQVVVFGHVQISTQALETLVVNEIPVALLTGYARFIATVAPPPAKNVSLREAQFRRFADPAECLSLAREVVRAKLTNQRALLMRCLRSRPPASGGSEPPDSASGGCEPPGVEPSRGSDEPAARDLAELLNRLDRATEIESLLGLEGQGAALYFGEFGRFLKAQPPGRGFDFRVRNRRPPRDPVNCLLSFAYALLVKDCFSALCTVGFDPYKGFYHVGRHGRPSLALDLMEEFRAVIADSVVLSLINNRSVTPDDFLTWREACQLTDGGRKKFFEVYETRKSTVVSHPVYGYKMSYSRMLEVQARMLAAYVRGDVPRYTGFTVR
ncbi:MAG TPA: CRISPR-associated endonuclease Cas1 [Gemmataceae bacterium]|nr:CRISPR-associated endonuclease Cas1 [Gemmataceae bacterium]